ncbi:MAG: hypothetical protein ACLPLP_11470, partial [Mycobacterium sp.]
MRSRAIPICWTATGVKQSLLGTWMGTRMVQSYGKAVPNRRDHKSPARKMGGTHAAHGSNPARDGRKPTGE